MAFLCALLAINLWLKVRAVTGQRQQTAINHGRLSECVECNNKYINTTTTAYVRTANADGSS